MLVERGDGFQRLKALLPPPSRRALVLIDPPYEVKQDYKQVRDALDEALGRFPTGIYAVWYPVLQRMESRQFADTPEAPAGQGMAARDPDRRRRPARTASACTAAACSS